MAPARPNRLPRWYPPAWRERYGEELLLYMQDSFGPGKPPQPARLSGPASSDFPGSSWRPKPALP